MSKHKVMIVNDSNVIRKYLSEIICSFGDCEICGSHSTGKNALEYLKHQKPDVIILDLEMPVLDGISFLEKFSNNNKIPVIIMSVYVNDQTEILKIAFELGATDAIGLPKDSSKEEVVKFSTLLHSKIIKSRLVSTHTKLKGD
jgi:two-component system chemotaxis response regulator CheB